jgi:hypothetical protein
MHCGPLLSSWEAPRPVGINRVFTSMTRRFGRATLVMALALAVISPGTSHAADGRQPGALLDPSFGARGLLRLSAEPSFTAKGLAAARHGTLLVSGGSGVQVLDSGGGAGRAFGRVGSLRLSAAKGMEFSLSDFVVDPRGRLLVVGDSLFPESENPSPLLENGQRAFVPSAVRILRFLPGGGLDRSFGQGGVVETDLDLAPPLDTDGNPLGPHPVVQATGIAVDPQGRIVVTGDAVARLGETCEHDSFAAASVAAGLVARFTNGGALDSSFGKDGLLWGHSLNENPLGAESIGDPVVGPRGEITYLSTGAYACEPGRSRLGVGQLTPNGQPRMAFGAAGAIAGPFNALARGPHGTVLALAEVPRSEKEDVKARLIRIAASGKLDGSFGKRGQTRVRLGPSFGTMLDSLAIDRRGRTLIGGTVDARKGRSIVLMRVSSHGKWEKDLGPRGRIATPVRQLAQFGSSDLFFDSRGRLITVHQYADELKGRSGLVVARYLLRD